MYLRGFGSDQAVCLEEVLVTDVLGLKERNDHMGGKHPLYLL